MKKKIIIGLKELRDHTETYIREVEKGKSFLVMRRSQPIFKITPVDEWEDEGIWNNVLDLSKNKKGGMPIAELLEKLHSLNGSSA